MTLAMIEQEFHGTDDNTVPAHKLAQHKQNKIKTTFDNVCLRYKTDASRLLLMPPAEVAKWVRSVDASLQVDDDGVSAAMRVYVQTVGTQASGC